MSARQTAENAAMFTFEIYEFMRLNTQYIVGKKLFLKRSVLQGNSVNLFPYLKLQLCSLAREGSRPIK